MKISNEKFTARRALVSYIFSAVQLGFSTNRISSSTSTERSKLHTFGDNYGHHLHDSVSISGRQTFPEKIDETLYGMVYSGNFQFYIFSVVRFARAYKILWLFF